MEFDNFLNVTLYVIVERRSLSPRCRFINTELGKQYLVFFIAFIVLALFGLLLLGYPLLLFGCFNCFAPHTSSMIIGVFLDRIHNNWRPQWGKGLNKLRYHG